MWKLKKLYQTTFVVLWASEAQASKILSFCLFGRQTPNFCHFSLVYHSLIRLMLFGEGIKLYIHFYVFLVFFLNCVICLLSACRIVRTYSSHFSIYPSAFLSLTFALRACRTQLKRQHWTFLSVRRAFSRSLKVIVGNLDWETRLIYSTLSVIKHKTLAFYAHVLNRRKRWMQTLKHRHSNVQRRCHRFLSRF